ncbi:Beta-mannosidase [Paenibacillus pasadenensis]|uniref:beta-mannosidase n=1 Tax=Paenibacillus pasadenensis TaxID=217090 RepID=A0A2N5N304_9BACL|nr:glycoside hydrolase family 2 TIM barrel-domain containing protein [Paenibacillus pasadenensis]PLT44714.1 Beta-mannosidase [Paenibacillus pasadenensis]
MEMRKLDAAWEVKGFWPWVPLKGTSMEIGNELLGVTEWIPATVPGGVHEDLYRAGLIPDPYVDTNSLAVEWVENRWWVYRGRFARPELEPGCRAELVLAGLDYEAIVSLNGRRLGEHEGMYEPAVYDVTELLGERETAELQIILKQAPDEMGQIGKTSETFTQKSRFNYKWDFSTRLVNVGIWDTVSLRVRRAVSLDELALHANVREDGTGVVSVAALARVEKGTGGAAAELELLDPDGRTAARWSGPVADGAVRAELEVPEPRLWHPNGYGEQPLYELRLRLFADGRLTEETTRRTGIRRIEYRRNPGGPDDALPYTFVVNGQPIYIQGANLTPLDHLYGNVGAERYGWLARLARRANLNLLRVWGGGLIEKEELYDLCDRLGILVWQEFIQSSSGIDNEPSQKPRFLELLGRSAVQALKTRRNHVSLAVWSGGNELMSAPDRPSTYEDANLAYLRALVAEHDPQRLFLPTSASGPRQYITSEKGVSHDVHGHWKYMGNPGHYPLYAEADHLFHSEFGVDGVSSVKSLRKFLSEPHRKPVSMEESFVWRHHGEWWDTFGRDTELFGGFADLQAFSDASQWIQAEGLRFILEANRRRQGRQSGSIIWQLNEPWPNASCTNLVDYYMEPKMAYYWTRSAFEGTHASLDYRSLDAPAGSRLQAAVHLHRRPGAAAGLAAGEVRGLDAGLAGTAMMERGASQATGEGGGLASGQSSQSNPQMDEREASQAGRASGEGRELDAGQSSQAMDEGLEANVTPLLRVRAEVRDLRGALLHEQTFDAPAGGETGAGSGSLRIGTLDWVVQDTYNGLLLVRLRIEGMDAPPPVDYFFSTRSPEVYAAALEPMAAALRAEPLGGWEQAPPEAGGPAASPRLRRAYVIANDGTEAALHVRPEETTDGWWMEASEAYFTLLPGESRRVELSCAPRRGELFGAGAAIRASDAGSVGTDAESVGTDARRVGTDEAGRAADVESVGTDAATRAGDVPTEPTVVFRAFNQPLPV